MQRWPTRRGSVHGDSHRLSDSAASWVSQVDSYLRTRSHRSGSGDGQRMQVSGGRSSAHSFGSGVILSPLKASDADHPALLLCFAHRLLATSNDVSAMTGPGAKEGHGGALCDRKAGQARLRHDRPARVHSGSRIQELGLVSVEILRSSMGALAFLRFTLPVIALPGRSDVIRSHPVQPRQSPAPRCGYCEQARI